jgi:hypothetical protein
VIIVKKLVWIIRSKQKDADETKFSDWDILNAVNECLRVMANEFSLRNSDFFEKEKFFEADEVLNGVDLPDDYITLRKVITKDGYPLSPSTAVLDGSTYMITNNKLYAKTSIRLLYKGFKTEVTIDDNIDFPITFIDIIVKITGLILNNGETDVLLQYVKDSSQSLIPHRRYSNVKVSMPFKV